MLRGTPRYRAFFSCRDHADGGLHLRRGDERTERYCSLAGPRRRPPGVHLPNRTWRGKRGDGVATVICSRNMIQIISLMSTPRYTYAIKQK